MFDASMRSLELWDGSKGWVVGRGEKIRWFDWKQEKMVCVGVRLCRLLGLVERSQLVHGAWNTPMLSPTYVLTAWRGGGYLTGLLRFLCVLSRESWVFYTLVVSSLTCLASPSANVRRHIFLATCHTSRDVCFSSLRRVCIFLPKRHSLPLYSLAVTPKSHPHGLRLTPHCPANSLALLSKASTIKPATSSATFPTASPYAGLAN